MGTFAIFSHTLEMIKFTDLAQYVGAIIAAWTVFGTVKYTSDAAWRIPVGMQAAMPVIQFALIFCLPESPRWLLSKDRPDEALAVLVKVSKVSGHWNRADFASTMQMETRLTISSNPSFMKFKKQSA
jgi:hypothetical protein